MTMEPMTNTDFLRIPRSATPKTGGPDRLKPLALHQQPGLNTPPIGVENDTIW
jgi:hypothetical protein